MRVKKFLKWVGITVGSLVALSLIAIAIVLNFIFTPEKLTPKVREIAGEYITTDFNIGSVELTFFSTFPDFSVKIDSIVVEQPCDTIQPLLSAPLCYVSFNPIALLDNEIVVNRVTLKEADINLYVDSLIRPINAFKLPLSDSTEVEEVDSTGSYAITLDNIEILSSSITVDDRTRDFYAKLDAIDLDLSASMAEEFVDFELLLSLPDIELRNSGVTFAEHERLSVDAKMKYIYDSMQLSITRGNLMVNSIDLTTSGVLRADSTRSRLFMDLGAELSTPSISEFMRLIPSNFIDKKEELTTDGVVDLAIEAKGMWSDSLKPIVTARVDIENAKAKYKSRKLSIDDIDCDADVYIDFNKPQTSYAKVTNFRFSSSKIVDMNVKGYVANLLGDPKMDLDLYADFDFSRFTELFPLQDGVELKGQNMTDVKVDMALSDIMNANYGKFYIEGESLFTDMTFSVDAQTYTGDSTRTGSLFLDVKRGRFLFGERAKADTKSRTLLSDIALSGLGLKDKDGNYFELKDLKMRAGANFDNKTKEVNGVGVILIAQDVSAGIEQQMDVDLKRTDMTFTLAPKREGSPFKATGDVKCDSLTAFEYANNSELIVSKADGNFSLTQLGKKKWDLKADIGFSHFGLGTDLFPLDMDITKSRLTMDGNVMKLKNTKVKIGESDIVATGKVKNFFAVMFMQDEAKKNAKKLEGKLTIRSKYLNLTELMDATSQSVMLSDSLFAEGDSTVQNITIVETVSISSDADSLAMVDSLDAVEEDAKLAKKQARKEARKNAKEKAKVNKKRKNKLTKEEREKRQAELAEQSTMFLVPKNIDFDLKLNLKKVVYDGGEIDSLVGKATIKDGVVSLNKLTLRTIGAKAYSSMVYRNVNLRKSRVYLDMSLKDVDIDRLSELMPSIDTLMPMMQSFEGSVDLDMRAVGVINNRKGFDFSKVRAAVDISGRDLVLMDSETFKDLSKMLLFKNKKRNLIDSMALSITSDSARVDVLPFKLAIDRYQAIVGGTQVVDTAYNINFDYNVSIMKSPLPFKAGVDLRGNLDDWDFDVTKAKLKNTDFDRQRREFEVFMTSIDSGEVVDDSANSKKKKKVKRPSSKNRATKAIEEDSTIVEADSVVLESVDSLATAAPQTDTITTAEQIEIAAPTEQTATLTN